MAEKENNIPQEIKDRLEGLNWPALEASTGITKESILKNETVARQLAYGAMTDLVYGHTADVSGAYSLRAIPSTKEGELGSIKAFTIEPEKDVKALLDKKQTLYLYGSPIYSENAIKALFEKTTISVQNKDGKDINVSVRANANAGIQIAVADPETKEKTYYLVSIHEPTNRVVGVPVSAVEKMLAKTKVYGVELSEEQQKSLVQGKAVIVNGCTNKDGETFSACVQFDAAKRQLVNAHPSWLRQAQKAGIDTGVSARRSAKVEKEQPKEAKKTRKTKSMKH